MWNTFLIHTTTGQIGPQVEFETLSWSISLNEIESLTGELKKSSMVGIDPDYWLSPWWGGILLTWDNIPIMAGPLVSLPTEYRRTVHLDYRGIRAIFGKRILVKEHTDWSTFRSSYLEWGAMSLGTIAKKVVQSAQLKTGGALPIAYPLPDQSAPNDDEHYRIFKGFDVQNNIVDEVLTKLANDSRGPDIMFRPRKINDSQLIWDMWHGRENDPTIPQSHSPIWDTTSQDGSVSDDLQVIRTGAHMTHRVFSVGAGMDKDTMIHMEQDLSPIRSGYPLLETAIAAGNSEQASVVQGIARGSLAANLHPLVEVTMTVRADGNYPLGTFWSGDGVQLVLGPEWFWAKEGIYDARILNMSGTLSSDVRLSIQTE
jgi:hypothetical protein